MPPARHPFPLSLEPLAREKRKLPPPGVNRCREGTRVLGGPAALLRAAGRFCMSNFSAYRPRKGPPSLSKVLRFPRESRLA
jgi:hypothetical protein